MTYDDILVRKVDDRICKLEVKCLQFQNVSKSYLFTFNQIGEPLHIFEILSILPYSKTKSRHSKIISH